MEWPRSTTARIFGLTFLALMLSSGILIGFVSRVTRGQLEAEAQAEVRAEHEAVLKAYRHGGQEAAATVIVEEIRVPGPQVFLLDDGRGKRLAGNIQAWPPTLTVRTDWRSIDLYRDGSDRPERFGVATDRLTDGSRLLIGRSLADEARLNATLGTSLAAAVGLALALAAASAALVTRFINSRVASIAQVAAAVAGGDLSRRVDDIHSRDAFGRLGIALNGMLQRIEDLLSELRAVTDGLAHDLRSPLTRLRARIDRVARGDEATEPALAGIAAEADHLRAMLDTTLEISRAEAGIGRENFSLTDLAALCRDMAEMYAPVAEDRDVRLTVDAEAPVPALVHREMIGRTLANLIDNALRYAADGKLVALKAEARDGQVHLSVADKGPGIPEEERGQALRRFGRLDAARRDGGAGLGLSLAMAVARLHGGTLVLGDNNPGLVVDLVLPLG
jgi:signal transduction histidine kinase